MNDWLRAGLVYVPLFIAGWALSEIGAPYLVGWFVASLAILLRMAGPRWLRRTDT